MYLPYYKYDFDISFEVAPPPMFFFFRFSPGHLLQAVCGMANIRRAEEGLVGMAHWLEILLI